MNFFQRLESLITSRRTVVMLAPFTLAIGIVVFFTSVGLSQSPIIPDNTPFPNATGSAVTINTNGKILGVGVGVALLDADEQQKAAVDAADEIAAHAHLGARHALDHGFHRGR